MTGGGSAGPNPQAGSWSLSGAAPNKLRRFGGVSHCDRSGLLCTSRFHGRTWLQVHEEHDVRSVPHGPEQLHHPGGVQSAPRAHLLPAEVTQRNLTSVHMKIFYFLIRSRLNIVSTALRVGACLSRLTLLAAHSNPVALSRTQNTSPYEPLWTWWRTQYSSPSLYRQRRGCSSFGERERHVTT